MTYRNFNSWKLLRLAGIPLLLTVMAGCSSIDDSDDDEENGGGVISRTLNESTTTNIDVGGEIISVTEIRALDAITINTSGATAEVRVADLQIADSTARYELSVDPSSADDETQEGAEEEESAPRSVILDLEVINTSAGPIVAEAEALLRVEDGVNVTLDDERLIEVLIELDYFTGSITYGERTSQIQEMRTSLQDLETALADQLPTLRTELESFQEGSTTELDLNSAIGRVTTALNDLNNEAASELTVRSFEINGLGLDFPSNIGGDLPLQYVDELGRYTRYAVAEFGEFDSNNDFIFNADNDVLNSVFSLEAPEPPETPETPETPEAVE